MFMQRSYRLFLDLDGVLADFDAGVLKATGKLPSDMNVRQMWPVLARTPGFYEHLPWTAEGRELWAFSRPHSPVILTGLPLGKWAEPQKRAWCARELGADVPVVCCLSREKGEAAAKLLEPGEAMVLVDDRLKVQQGWEDAGGRFILHTSTTSSIMALKDFGFT
jgi:hypothetical protein